MSQFTVIDAQGVPLFELGGSQDQVRANIPEGCALVEGVAQGDWWDGTAWRTKPQPPSKWHTWDWQSQQWLDLRSQEQLASDAMAEAQAAWQRARSQRDALLAATDWRVIRAQEAGALLDAAWLAYRQGLRDITQQPDPHNIVWPQAPTEGSQ